MAAKRKSKQRSAKESPDGTELLVLELQEIHSAESQLARVLPRLAKAVESETLQLMPIPSAAFRLDRICREAYGLRAAWASRHRNFRGSA